MNGLLINGPLQTPIRPIWSVPLNAFCLSVLIVMGLPVHLQAQITTTTKVLPTLFAIQLGTAPPVQIQRYEGGEPVSTAVVAIESFSELPNKQPSPLLFRDITFDYLPIPGAGLNTVLTDALGGNIQPISGAIVIMDSIKKELSRLSFNDAYVRSIEFPDMDVTLTGQMPVIRISLAVPHTATFPGSNQIIAYSAAVKGPVKSSFQLSIQNLETNSHKSVRVEPLRFTVPINFQNSQTQVGRQLDVTGRPDYANFIAVLPETEAASFIAWQQQLTLQGANINQLEKTGTLQWLSSDRTKSFLSLQLQNLGVLSVIRIPSKPGYVAVEMYCEKVVPQVF